MKTSPRAFQHVERDRLDFGVAIDGAAVSSDTRRVYGQRMLLAAATSATLHEMNEEAIACTLGAAALEAQRARWAQLCRTAEFRRARTEDGVRLEFRATPEVESELHALTSIERQCCAWATWTVTQNASLLVLEVSSTASGVEVVHGLF